LKIPDNISKGEKNPHPFAEIERCGGQHHVDAVAGRAFEVVPSKSGIGLQVSDDRFY
jgi:hypothetical protein